MLIFLLLILGLSLAPPKAYGWGNGSSDNIKYPYYGLHDVIADMAYQKLRDYNATAASWITEYYLNTGGSKRGDYQYSYGGESENWLSYVDDPDSYYKDWGNHVYYVYNGSQRGAPGRVEQCYGWIVANLTKWMMYGRVPRPIPLNYYANAASMFNASEYLHKAVYAAGLLTHYFGDLSQFGHTDWTKKDHSNPAYNPVAGGQTYHGYYESSMIGDSFIDKVLVDLGSYALKVDKRVRDAEGLTINFSRWVNAHDGNATWYFETSGKSVEVGSTYSQLLTEFVNNYNAGSTYLNSRGYSISLYGSTLLHVSAAVGNITQLLYSAYKEAEEEALILDRDRAATSIGLDPAPSTLLAGEALSPTVTLSTLGGSQVKGQTVYLSVIVNGSSQARYPPVSGSVVTDVSGRASWRYARSLSAGVYRFAAWYLGNETYGGSYLSGTFTVRLISTTLSLTLTPTAYGKAATLKATLKDENGKAVKSASVDFYVDDVKYGSASTDAEGVASLAYTASKTGVFQVRAVYGGGDTYAGSSSEVASLEVYFDYTLYAIGALLIVVAVAVALLIKRRF